MNRLLPTPGAELLKFYLTFHLFFILVGVIIAPFTDGAAHAYKIVRVFNLCHGL